MRPPEPVFLAGVAAELPPDVIRFADAVRDGRYPEREWEFSRYESVHEWRDDRTPVAAAADAAKRALGAAGVDPLQVGMVVYGGIHLTGHRYGWAPYSFLQGEIGARDAFGFTLGQSCNSLLAGVELGVSHLLGRSESEAVLVAGADRFSEGLGANRWEADYGVVYGDGAAAGVVARTPRGFRIAALNTLTDPRFESMNRDDAPTFREVPRERFFRAKDRKRAFLTRRGHQFFSETIQSTLGAIFGKTLKEAGWDAPDVDHLVFPNLGYGVLESAYFPLCAGAEERSLWSLGRTLCHVGACDQLIGVAHLAESGRVAAGAKIVLVGVGAGHSYSCVALETCDVIPSGAEARRDHEEES